MDVTVATAINRREHVSRQEWQDGEAHSVLKLGDHAALGELVGAEIVEKAPATETRLYRSFLDSSPAIHFIKDAEGRFLYYDRSFCDRFAVSQEEWLGKSVFDLFPHEFASAYHTDDLEVLTTGVSKVVEETSPGPNESILYWRTHKFAIPQDDGSFFLGGLLLDVSSEQQTVARLRLVHAQLEAANVELEELSRTDGLTGLWNRRAFDERLAQELETGALTALLVLDLDHFKSLNDSFGHPYGDEILREVAKILKAGCRGNDCVARHGGEEFGILLIGAGQAKALEIAERLRQSVELHGWPKRAITVSIGLSMAAQHNDAGALVAKADVALYRAKQMGKNRVCTDLSR